MCICRQAAGPHSVLSSRGAIRYTVERVGKTQNARAGAPKTTKKHQLKLDWATSKGAQDEGCVSCATGPLGGAWCASAEKPFRQGGGEEMFIKSVL